MSRTIKIFASIAVLAAVPAFADVHRRHGALCAPKYGQGGLIGADERGTYNGSTAATATVTCAAEDRLERNEANYDSGNTWKQTSGVNSITVHGRDLSATTPFSCYLFWTAEDGFSSWGPTKYTCSQAGGCPDSTSEYVGAATLTWDLTPYGGTIGNHDAIGVVCNLPPTTISGSSYVKSIETFDEAIGMWAAAGTFVEQW